MTNLQLSSCNERVACETIRCNTHREHVDGVFSVLDASCAIVDLDCSVVFRILKVVIDVLNSPSRKLRGAA